MLRRIRVLRQHQGRGEGALTQKLPQDGLRVALAVRLGLKPGLRNVRAPVL